MAVLKWLTGDLAGTLVELKGDVTVIGRLPECDIILAAQRGQPAACRDPQGRDRVLSSSISIAEQDVPQRHRVEGGVPHRLKENDRINICDVEFVYYPVEPTKAKGPEPAVRHHGGHRERRPGEFGIPHARSLAINHAWSARFVPR